MNKLKITALALVFGAICFSAGKFLSPAKVETREVEKIVYRERTDTTKKETKKETTLPDGTKIVETETETKRTTDKSADIDKQKETATTNRNEWLVSIGYAPSLNTSEPLYILTVQRRMFSEVYVGAFVTTQKTIGISFSMGF